MPKEYSIAPDEIQTMVGQLLQKNYQKLVKCNFKVGVLVQSTYEDDELVAGLKVHGMNAAACISKIPAKRRIHVPYDAEIIIDGFWLDQHPDAEARLALLDHELYHIKAKEKDGKVVLDEDGRVKFKLQPDELYFTGFSAIVLRHGMAAGEAQEALAIAKIVNENLELHKQRPAGHDGQEQAPEGGVSAPEADVTFTVISSDEAEVDPAPPEAAAA